MHMATKVKQKAKRNEGGEGGKGGPEGPQAAAPLDLRRPGAEDLLLGDGLGAPGGRGAEPGGEEEAEEAALGVRARPGEP